MRILRIHAPGTDPALAEAVGDAVRVFNSELDIRLRFLAIGIEEQIVEVGDPAHAAEAVATAVRRHTPEAVVLMGDGETAVAAAASVKRSGSALVRVGAGGRGGPHADAARAVDRLATLLLAHGEEAMTVLETEELTEGRHDVGPANDPETGARIVRALCRARRANQGGR